MISYYEILGYIILQDVIFFSKRQEYFHHKKNLNKKIDLQILNAS